MSKETVPFQILLVLHDEKMVFYVFYDLGNCGISVARTTTKAAERWGLLYDTLGIYSISN